MKKLLPLFLLFLASPAGAIAWSDPLGNGNVTLQTAAGRILAYVLGFVGVIGLCGYVYGGFLWMVASGDSKKVSEARSVIVWTTVGMATIIFSYAIVSFLVNSLAATTNPPAVPSGGGSGGSSVTGSNCPDGAAEACTSQGNNNEFDFGTCACRYSTHLFLDQSCSSASSCPASQCASGSSPSCFAGACACEGSECGGACPAGQSHFIGSDGTCGCQASAQDTGNNCVNNSDCAPVLTCSIGHPACAAGSHTCFCSPI